MVIGLSGKVSGSWTKALEILSSQSSHNEQGREISDTARVSIA